MSIFVLFLEKVWILDLDLAKETIIDAKSAFLNAF